MKLRDHDQTEEYREKLGRITKNSSKFMWYFRYGINCERTQRKF